MPVVEELSFQRILVCIISFNIISSLTNEQRNENKYTIKLNKLINIYF